MLTMERHRYTDNRRDYELKTKATFLDGKHSSKQLHHNNDDMKSLVSKKSRSFADDVSNDQLEVRHHRHHRHHNHHNHHHRHHRHRHRHHNDKKKNIAYDDDDDINVEGKMLDGDLEDISSELDEMDKPQEKCQLTTAQLEVHHTRSQTNMDSPSVISVSSSHSSLSNKNYSHSPAVIVDNESPHGHNNQPSSPGKLKLQKIRCSKRSHPPTPTPSAKRSRSNGVSRSQSLEASDSEASKSDSSRSSRLSSGSSSDSIRSRSSSNSSDSQTSTHSADIEEVSNEIFKVTNNGTVLEKAVSSTPETANQTDDMNGDNQDEEEEKCTLPDYYPGVQGCRSVEEFQCLNRIEEGTYGVVYRAKDKKTDELVALKRLKMEKETEGFPITSLREINTLLKGQHPNIVTVREIVVGSNMDQIFIVMDYVEHDLKSLMTTMKSRKQCFLPSEVKCLTQQLLCAVAHLHDNWILHRDLKTSNLLLSHKGILKVADFGLAREYGSPLKRYTPVVVTLWYRAPELLLCSPEYSTPVDMWSVGCIFAEMIRMHALFTGQTEIDQLSRIYKELGTPNEKIWPGYKDLPAVKNMLSQNSQFTDYPISNLKKRFANNTTEIGIDLLQGMLTYDPERRLSAEKALQHEYFKELPLPIDPSMFPTWPAKSELGERKQAASPKPPPGGTQFKQQLDGLDGQYTKGAGFQLKF